MKRRKSRVSGIHVDPQPHVYICEWCEVPVVISVKNPLCNGMHFDCMKERKESLDRRDKPKQQALARAESAKRRGVNPAPEPKPIQPEPEPKPLEPGTQREPWDPPDNTNELGEFLADVFEP
jgi:hypothetical protein